MPNRLDHVVAIVTAERNLTGPRGERSITVTARFAVLLCLQPRRFQQQPVYRLGWLDREFFGLGRESQAWSWYPERINLSNHFPHPGTTIVG